MTSDINMEMELRNSGPDPGRRILISILNMRGVPKCVPNLVQK